MGTGASTNDLRCEFRWYEEVACIELISFIRESNALMNNSIFLCMFIQALFITDTALAEVLKML